MKVFEDDCELRWSMEKLELGGQVIPLAGKRSGNQCVAATVREGDETASDGGASRAELTLRINAGCTGRLVERRLCLANDSPSQKNLAVGEPIPSSISHWGV